MSPNSNSRNGLRENGYGKIAGDKEKPKKYAFKEKQFEIRNSPLTDLCDNVPTLMTVKSIFGSTIIFLFTSIILKDYMEIGEVTLGVYLIRNAFKKLHVVAAMWICYLMATFSVFYIFKIWAAGRLKLIAKRNLIKIWDRMWMTAVLIFYIAAFLISSILISHFELPIASSTIITLEQIRFVMKIHAFIRYNAEKVASYKPHSEQEAPRATFGQYLYFLFAPVMLYRPEYPRTKRIRWGFALARAAEVIGVVVYQCFLFHRFILPSYKDFGLRKYTWAEVVAPAVAENSVPALLILFSGFYVTLHSVQNLFAELLRFGDREFYKDWWTSVSLAEYFRTWNIVVQDWLYAHVYYDVYRLSGSKTLGKLSVFLVSVIAHEWAMTYIFGFFYPALSYSFLLGAMMSFVQVPKFRYSNLLFWYIMTFGTGLTCSLYTLEYYARVNQPEAEVSSWLYYFVPRWYTCDCIV